MRKHEGGILTELGSVRLTHFWSCARGSNSQHLLEQFPYAPLLSEHQTPNAPCIPSSAHVASPVCTPHAPRLKPEVVKDSPAAISPCPLTHSGIFQIAFFFFFLNTQNLTSLFSFQRPCPPGHHYNLLSPLPLELF